jgi:ABC-type glycerol-3-phosphate transport system substrate-binding protein
MTARTLAALLGCLVLAACGGEEGADAPPPVSDTAFGPAVGTMDRARAVEHSTMQHKQELDRAMDAAEDNL